MTTHRFDHVLAGRGALSEGVATILELRVVHLVAFRNTGIATLCTRVAGVDHQWTHPRHELACRGADICAVHAEVHRLGVAGLTCGGLSEAMVKRLAALPLAVKACVGALSVRVIFVVGGGGEGVSGTYGGQSSRCHAQGS